MTLSRGAYAFRRLASARALYEELHGTTVPGTSFAADTVLTVRGADADAFKAALLRGGADVNGIVVKLVGATPADAADESAPIAGKKEKEKEEKEKEEVIDTSADVDGVVFGGTTLFRFRSARATGGAGASVVDDARAVGDARIDDARIDDALKDKWFLSLPAPRGHLAFVADPDLAALLWVHVSPAARAVLSLELTERFSHCGSLADARAALRDFRGRWLRAPPAPKEDKKAKEKKKKATTVGAEADDEGWTTVARR